MQRCHRSVPLPEAPECRAEFVLRRGPARLLAAKLLQALQRAIRIAAGAMRDGQEQRGYGMIGRHLENLDCLFGSQHRLRRQEPSGMAQCDFKRAQGL
jgi:hypothetical protein